MIEYYENKVNVGVIDNLDVALAYTCSCGDAIKIYLEIDEEGVEKKQSLNVSD